MVEKSGRRHGEALEENSGKTPPLNYHAWVHHLAIPSALWVATLFGAPVWVLYAIGSLPILGETIGWFTVNKTWDCGARLTDSLHDWWEYYWPAGLVLLIRYFV